jgi:hypothetical protein
MLKILILVVFLAIEMLASGVIKRNGTERNGINGIFQKRNETERKIFEKMRNEKKRN